MSKFSGAACATAGAWVDVASSDNVVASGGSESVVSLLGSVLNEEVLVASILESESPSVTDVEATSFLDLVLESTEAVELDWGTDLVHHVLHVGSQEI